MVLNFENQQREPVPDMTELYASQPDPNIGPMMMSSTPVKSDILDKINPDEVVEMLYHKLKGEELVNGDWRQVRNDGVMTDEGARRISNLMLAVSNKNTPLCNLTPEETSARVINVCDDALRIMLENRKKFGITSIGQMYEIHSIVFSIVKMAMNQPQNNGIRNLLNHILYENRNYTNVGNMPGSKPGIFQRLLGAK